MKPNYIYEATLIKVIDGDTVDLLVSLGFDVYTKTRVRLYGINTPEIRTKDKAEKLKGLKAKAFTLLFCRRKKLLIRSHDGNEIDKGKFGRWLTIIEDENGRNLNDLLVQKKHAEKREY